MSRALAIAKRCQLLTGSYNGATRSCSCVHMNKCPFSKQSRDEYKDHPEIVKARERNFKEFQELNPVAFEEVES